MNIPNLFGFGTKVMASIAVLAPGVLAYDLTISL